MADFNRSFEKMLQKEGGYVLSNTSGDSGGMTFAGISRRNFPMWDGWDFLEHSTATVPELKSKVMDFYYKNFWLPIRGNDIRYQYAADCIFDYAVNAGVKTSILAMQRVIKVKDDGIFGNNTLEVLNATEKNYFLTSFSFARIERYIEIATKNPTQVKFLHGWFHRVVENYKEALNG